MDFKKMEKNEEKKINVNLKIRKIGPGRPFCGIVFIRDDE